MDRHYVRGGNVPTSIPHIPRFRAVDEVDDGGERPWVHSIAKPNGIIIWWVRIRSVFRFAYTSTEWLQEPLQAKG